MRTEHCRPEDSGRRAYSPIALVVAALVVTSAQVLAPEHAHAYRTAADLPEIGSVARWAPSTIPFETARRFGQWTDDEAADVARRAFDAWATTDCDTPTFRHAGVATNGAVYGDGRNTIEWIRSGWTSFGFDRSAGAITELRYARTADTWEIVEFDIYINAEHHRWTLDAVPPDGQRSLVGALTHEAGHVLGLLHPCEIDGMPGVPMCLPQDFMAVMHPENALRVELGADDIAGLCTLYPATPCDTTSCPTPLTCDAGRCIDPCTGVACPSGSECDGGRCSPCVGDDCPSDCASSEDCDGAAACIEGRCSPPGNELGDPCAASVDCASGVCHGLGFCTRACGDARTCPSDWSCNPASSTCAPSGGVLGSPCTSGPDCVSQFCFVRGDEGRCTRPCGDGCPWGLTCLTVDGQDVCATARPASTCSAGPGTPSPVSSVLLSLTVLWFLVWSSRVRKTQ